MTSDSKTALLQAYRAAIKAEQDEIADMLEGVILSEMHDTSYPLVSLGNSRTTTNPPWYTECTPLYAPRGEAVNAKVEFTGIDHLSKETTV